VDRPDIGSATTHTPRNFVPWPFSFHATLLVEVVTLTVLGAGVGWVKLNESVLNAKPPPKVDKANKRRNWKVELKRKQRLAAHGARF
jgi:hypothetical protein